MSTIQAIRQMGAEGVSFAYGTNEVVSRVTFRVEAGEILAVVGPNGCGKSTLLRLIVGQLRPTEGRIVIDGGEVRTWSRPALARRVALVPQQMGGAGAVFGYTVQEMVLMARHAAHGGEGWNGIGFETAGDLQIAREAMWAADVHHLAERSVDTLSGGERQRVMIARAFTQRTPIILLDEPTSALDLHHQLELMEQIRRATKDEKRTALLVTHDLNLALTHADRAVVMDRGKVVAEGRVGEVLTAGVLEPVYRVRVRAESGVLRFSRGETG
ncbi:MAG TPA: ABC transporter ATP-binding protein [Phycisphaerae bacterium]|nr:ABC transporter ATP-binding protein [Phycisphaerae bacterium]